MNLELVNSIVLAFGLAGLIIAIPCFIYYCFRFVYLCGYSKSIDDALLGSGEQNE